MKQDHNVVNMCNKNVSKKEQLKIPNKTRDCKYVNGTYIR